MEDWWKRAKTFAEEAAKKSQDLTNSAKLTDLISETTKKSKELALEASKKAEQLKLAALKQADQFKSIADTIAPPFLNSSSNAGNGSSDPELDYEKLGVTDDLREFVKGFTAVTFQNFPTHDDDSQTSDVPRSESNVRQDLNEWQAKHATLVLTTVKGISKLRYELCPKVMKEKRFWRIYFTLVSTHVALATTKLTLEYDGPLGILQALSNGIKFIVKENLFPSRGSIEAELKSVLERQLYEKKYMEEVKLKAEKQAKEDKLTESSASEIQKSQSLEKNVKDNKASTSSSAQQDLDSFLLGDLGDSDDEGPDDDDDEGMGSFSDDFDKIENIDEGEDQHKPTA